MTRQEFIDITQKSGFDIKIHPDSVFIFSNIADPIEGVIAQYYKDREDPYIYLGPFVSFDNDDYRVRYSHRCEVDSIFDPQLFSDKLKKIYADEKKIIKEIRLRKIKEL